MGGFFVSTVVKNIHLSIKLEHLNVNLDTDFYYSINQIINKF